MKKVFARIGTLLLVMAMTLALIPGAAFAADDNTIVLTKLTKLASSYTDTDGVEITDTSSYGSALANVTFTLYKTDVAYKDFAGIGTGTNQVPTAGASLDASIPSSWTVAKTGTTDSNGQITWTGLADGIYYLVETAAPDTVQTKSVSAYIMLPYTYTKGTQAGTTTDTVYVYPKNVMKEASITAQKVSDGNATDTTNTTYEVAATGEDIVFTSTFTLGATTKEITELTIDDTSDASLSVPDAAADVTIALGNTTFTPVTDYTLTNPSANTFEIEFTSAGLAAVKAAYSSSVTDLTVEYTSNFTGTAASEYRNTITITTDDSNPDSTAITASDYALITTGSATITKYKEGGTDTLAGVTFTLTGPDGYSEEATTDANGVASWTGLGDGQYTVQETGTVGGYALNPNAQTFSIEDVVDSIASSNTDLNWVGSIQNYTQPKLPLTGGSGIALIVLAGTALIGGAVLLMKKRSAVK